MQIVLIQFENENYELISERLQVPSTITKRQLLSLIKGEETLNLYINGLEILKDIESTIEVNPEELITITTHQDEKKSSPSAHCSSSFSGHEAPVLCVKILDDKIITCGGDCTLRIWDKITKTQKKIIKRDKHWIMCLDADNEKIVTGAMDGRINIYDSQGNHKNTIETCKNTITGIKIVKDKIIISSRDRTVRIFKNNITIFSYAHDQPVNGFLYKDNYLMSFGRDGKLKIFYDREQDPELTQLKNKIDTKEKYIFIKEIQKNSPITAIEKNKEYLIIGCEDGTVNTYENFNPLYKITHAATITSISSDGLFCATGSFDKKVKIFTLNKGNIIFTYTHNDWVYKLILNNSFIISSSKDKTIKIYDYKKKKLISDLICRDEIYCYDYHNKIIVAGCKDRMVYFFE